MGKWLQVAVAHSLEVLEYQKPAPVYSFSLGIRICNQKCYILFLKKVTDVQREVGRASHGQFDAAKLNIVWS